MVLKESADQTKGAFMRLHHKINPPCIIFFALNNNNALEPHLYWLGSFV
jgi:hypothetical protein